MAKEEIESKLKDIICEYVDVEKNSIDSNMNFSYDIGLDSFGMASMVCSIEDAFEIKISDSELAGFRTLSDMAGFIHEAKAI